MKFPSQLRSLCLLGTLLLAPGALLHAQYANGQSASSVLGQANFSTKSTATTQSGFTMSTASPASGGIAVDNTSGKVFVVDTVNNRILRFSSTAAFANGGAAEAVIGQTDFTTGTVDAGQTTTTTPPVPAPSAMGLNAPVGAIVDSSGILWVADAGNNRVLAFFGAASLATGASANLVLGQSSFTTSTAGASQVNMFGPTGVAMDSTGTLYVADRQNNRVLRFANAASLSNGAFATGLFGQTNYLATVTGTTQSTFGSLPWGVATDSSGNLWVADTANNRVLCFNSAATAAVGANASLVLGQTDFTTGTTSPASQSTFNAPVALTFDSIGRLYVSDFSNNRILVFEQPSSLTNGANASFVLGQSDFTSGGAANPPTAASLNNPQGLSYLDSGYLWVADAGNNRALPFAITAGVPTLVAHPVKAKLRAGKSKTYSVVLTGTQASDEYTLQASVPKGTTNKASVKFLINGENVTSALKSGTYQTSELLVNGTLSISVQVKARASARGNLKYSLTATSVTNSSNSATTSSTIQVVVPQS